MNCAKSIFTFTMIKYYLIFLLFISFKTKAQKISLKTYKERGDTLIINGKRLSPGDTLHLNYGSNKDSSFNYIWQKPLGEYNGANEKLISLPATYSNGFLIYGGRADQGFKKIKVYSPIFFDPRKKEIKYNLLLLRALETGELKGF